ncbi:MAG: hypothetical protein JNM80_01120 [Phycisphaerae bacterium]|nr:hypothetical protein [Phycisphaerae bacterium]
MNTKNTIPTKADLDAMLPALRALANTTPFGFAKVTHSDAGGGGGTANPDVSIDLPTPGGSPICINAHVAYGSVWEVTVSSASFRLGTPDEVRTTAAVLNVAHAIAALLASITTTPTSR